MYTSHQGLCEFGFLKHSGVGNPLDVPGKLHDVTGGRWKSGDEDWRQKQNPEAESTGWWLGREEAATKECGS